MKQDLLSIRVSNLHQSLLLKDDAAFGLLEKINWEPLARSWTPVDFVLKNVDGKSKRIPNICTVYIGGVLAFPEGMRDSIFPATNAGLEFLPITVDGKRWLLLNCLNTVNEFDEKDSTVMRGPSGQIFMVSKLKVTDPLARDYELFTLAESNRANLFVLSSFKDRIERLGLQGITFQLIGDVG